MIETNPGRGTSRTGILALILSGLSLVLSLVACGAVGLDLLRSGGDPLPVQSEPQAATASQVEAVAHVTLPPGTVLLAAAYSNGLETRLSATLRLPRSGLDAFLASGAFTAPLTPGLRAITAAHNVGGGNLWRPEAATDVSGLTEQQPTPDGTRRSLMLDLGAPDAVTAYLYAGRG